MWKVEATGNADKMYELLNDTFIDQHTTTEEVPGAFTVPGRESKPNHVRKVDEGVSQQFRLCAKAFQGMSAGLSGRIKVTCGGDKKKNIYINIEDA